MHSAVDQQAGRGADQAWSDRDLGAAGRGHNWPSAHWFGPTANAHVESFNGTLRAECLETHWFATLEDAEEIIETWQKEYNESRPHKALGERTANNFARQVAAGRNLTGLQSVEG